MLNKMISFKCQASGRGIAGLLVGLVMSGGLFAESITVRHDHDPWGSCTGRLEVTARGILYEPEQEDSHRSDWTWSDIQTVDRHSARQFTVVTYQDQRWLLGRDRRWHFTVVDPKSEGLSDQLLSLVRERLERPVVDRVAMDFPTDYLIPVKHLHTLGGCEGTLSFSHDWIVYRTEHREDARSWRRVQDVANVWSTGPYDLELEVYETHAGDLLRTRRYRFQLKRPLDQDYYARLRRELLPDR